MFRTVLVVCAVSSVLLVVLGVLLTGWGGCSQDGEDAVQDGVQQLQLQHRLQSREIVPLVQPNPEQCVDSERGRTDLALQPDEEGDAGEAFDSQGVTQRRVAAHLTETGPTL